MKNGTKSCNVKWILHCNISRNGYGNAVVGRYGGCFEEDNWLMCRITRGSPPTELDVLAKYAPSLNEREGIAQHQRG